MNSTAVGLLSVSIIFPLLSLLAVLLRFWARRLRSSPEADDWVIVCAQVPWPHLMLFVGGELTFAGVLLWTGC
jgi:hypothetical protein